MLGRPLEAIAVSDFRVRLVQLTAEAITRLESNPDGVMPSVEELAEAVVDALLIEQVVWYHLGPSRPGPTSGRWRVAVEEGSPVFRIGALERSVTTEQ